MSMEKFHHTLPDGYELVLPKFENVPMGLIRKTRRLDKVDQVFTLLEELATEQDLEHLDTLARAGFQALMKDWQASSEVTPGESSAS